MDTATKGVNKTKIVPHIFLAEPFRLLCLVGKNLIVRPSAFDATNPVVHILLLSLEEKHLMLTTAF